MTDYSRLPRAELIKEIMVWRDRCVDQQIVYVDDLEPFIEEAIKKHEESLSSAINFYNQQALAYEEKREELGERVSWVVHADRIRFAEAVKDNVIANSKKPSLREAIINFFGGKK